MMHVHITDKGIQSGRQIFPKCLRRCKSRCEGPWHWLVCLTEWKQGFIFSNLWSQCRWRSIRRRRMKGVPIKTLGGEAKDIVQDKLSSPDADERHPASRNKWDWFYFNLTFIWLSLSILHLYIFFFWQPFNMYIIKQACTATLSHWQWKISNIKHANSFNKWSVLFNTKTWEWKHIPNTKGQILDNHLF